MSQNFSGKQIQKLRIQNGLSQQELAEKIGVSQGLISAIELGNRKPSIDNQNKLIKTLLGKTKGVKKGKSANLPDVSPIGIWLNKMRNKNKLTIAELAEKAGVTYQAISNLEVGKTQSPQKETIKNFEKVFKEKLPVETQKESDADSIVEGVGQIRDFDPHDNNNLPQCKGIYVFYDISNRPIYVGMVSGNKRNIAGRVREHRDKFWFKAPIVETGMYIEISNPTLCKQIEAILVKFLKDNAIINKQLVDRDEER